MSSCLATHLFRALCILTGLVAFRVLFWPIAMVMQDMAHYLSDRPLAVYAHIVFGPVALILMPLQFIENLRRHRPRLHRTTGYGYAVSILIAGTASLVLLPAFLGSLWAATGFVLLAVFWIGSTALAIAAARRRDFAAHRMWMIRSAAMTFGAVSLRLYLFPLLAAGWTLPAAYDLLAWISWVPNLIAVELWRHRRIPA